MVGCRGARVRFFPWHKHVLPPLCRHRGRQTRSRLSGEHGPGGGHHGTDGEGAARLQLEQPGPGSEPPPPSSPPRACPLRSGSAPTPLVLNDVIASADDVMLPSPALCGCPQPIIEQGTAGGPPFLPPPPLPWGLIPTLGTSWGGAGTGGAAWGGDGEGANPCWGRLSPATRVGGDVFGSPPPHSATHGPVRRGPPPGRCRCAQGKCRPSVQEARGTPREEVARSEGAHGPRGWGQGQGR